MKSKPKWKLCGLAMLALSLWLTGCGTSRSAYKVSPPLSVNLYQPPILRLTPGMQVQTRDGIYTPQTVETWHSQARFRELELQVQDLAAALAQERAKPR